VGGEAREIQRGVAGHVDGDDELGVVVLGRLLEAGGDVDRVADGREVEAFAPAHPADDRRAGVDADADPDAQRRRKIAGQLGAERRQAFDHRARGGERLATAGGRPDVDPEQRHHPVAGELVGDAAGLGDCRPDGLEITVQDEDDVVGQLVLGHSCKATEIGEEDGEFALTPLPHVRRERVSGRRRGRQQRHDRDVANRTGLAGEANVGRGAHAREHALLGLPGGG